MSTAPYHHTGWPLNFATRTVRRVLFIFGPVDTTTSTISENNFNCGLVRPQTSFPLFISASSMSSGGPENPAVFLDVGDTFYIVKIKVALRNIAPNCIYSFLMCRLKDQRSLAMFTLACSAFSRFSGPFDVNLDCRCWTPRNSLELYVEENSP